MSEAWGSCTSEETHWRDTARTPTLWMPDGTIVLLLPAIFLDLFTGLHHIPTVLIFFALTYYLVIAFVLKMPLFRSFKWLRWTFFPKIRPSRRPVYIRKSYDLMGIGSWRLTKLYEEGDK
jgi:hypothetical protein